MRRRRRSRLARRPHRRRRTPTHKQTKPNNSAEWVEERTLIKNYAANDLLVDPNEAFGRNSNAPRGKKPLKSAEQRAAEGGEALDDYDGALLLILLESDDLVCLLESADAHCADA